MSNENKVPEITVLLRKNILTDELVGIAPKRAARPTADGGKNAPAAKSKCPFCGFDKYPRIYPNDFPVFSHLENYLPTENDFQPYGDCGVVLYTAEHAGSLANVSDETAGAIVDVWKEHDAEMHKDPKHRVVFYFENRGVMSGCTMIHPHAQVYVLPFLPPKLKTELVTARRAYEQDSSKSLMQKILTEELEYGKRIVYENESFVAFVPAWSEVAYGLMILPRRHCPNIAGLTDKERADLGKTIKTITGLYDHLWADIQFYPYVVNQKNVGDEKPDNCHVFPYMMGVYQTPMNLDGEDAKEFAGCENYYDLNLQYFPVLRSEESMQWQASMETLMDFHTNPSNPDVKAAELREALKRYLA